MKDLKILFVFLAVIKFSSCWWDIGHMMVAKVAQLDLIDRNPLALELAENITSVLNAYSHGKIRSFVESACWPDDIKQFKLGILDPWHYINVPIRLDDPDPYPHISYSGNDCAALIKTAMKVLTNWTKHELSDLQKNIFEKSMMLRYLVHVVGDIHQPLHAVQLFDNEHFPKGDVGGNLFLVNYTKNINNLHKFFDSGADSIPGEIYRPLDNDTNQEMAEIARSYMNEFPSDTSLPKNLEVETWITESYLIAKGFIYKNITYKGTITESYKENSYKIVKQRIAQAGFRLARFIEQIYESYVNAKKNVSSHHFLK